MAAGESSLRHQYILEACGGGEGDDSDMGISEKRATEGKAGKQIMSCWRDVEEVGKEQRPLGRLDEEGWGLKGKGMWKGLRRKERS